MNKLNSNLAIVENMSHDALMHDVVPLQVQIDALKDLEGDYSRLINNIQILKDTIEEGIYSLFGKGNKTLSNNEDIFYMFDLLKISKMYKEPGVNIKNTKTPNLMTDNRVLTLVFYNLMKNSKSQKAKNITFEVEKVDDLLNRDVLYHPIQLQPHRINGHYGISITDDGEKGFSNKHQLEDFLKKDISTTGGGIGLHLTKLAADYLGASIEIESEPGNTKVTIYHPIFTKWNL